MTVRPVALMFCCVLVLVPLSWRVGERAVHASTSSAAATSGVLSAQSDDLQTNTSVAVLVDISKSFAPLTKPDQAALEQLERAIERAASAVWEPPVTIYWATIGSSGVLASSSVCGSALFHPRMVNRTRNDEFSSVPQLQAWLRECVRAVVTRSQRPEPYTDISGTVAIAADSGRRTKGRKIITVLSDFAEDRPPGTKPTSFELSGEQMVMLYRAQPTDAADGNLLFMRLKQWEERFRSAGAKGVCRVPIVGATSNSIASCF